MLSLLLPLTQAGSLTPTHNAISLPRPEPFKKACFWLNLQVRMIKYASGAVLYIHNIQPTRSILKCERAGKE